jgi:hypothetical protein
MSKSKIMGNEVLEGSQIENIFIVPADMKRRIGDDSQGFASLAGTIQLKYGRSGSSAPPIKVGLRCRAALISAATESFRLSRRLRMS